MRIVRIALIALCALAAGPLSGLGVPTAAASVVAPELVITSPADGSVINDTTPAFHGTSTAPGDGFPEAETVIVRVYNEAKKEVLERTSSGEPGQAWTVGPADNRRLAPGTYTAIAEQTSGLFTGRSPAVTFKVDITPPQVVISSPSNGSSTTSEAQVFSGTAGSEAGDLPAVTLEVFAGPAASGPALEALTIGAVAGSWSVVLAGLGPGTYTVQASESDWAGNVGVSGPVTFSVSRPAQATPGPPVASFRWFPASPTVGQTVALVSSSTDTSSPITAFVWDLLGNGPFKQAGPVVNTSFTTPGNHSVRLRVTDARGASSAVTETIPVRPVALALMQPFPIVRIAGSETSVGVKLSQLTVQAPVGATVTVRCRLLRCGLHAQRQLARASRRHKRSSVVLAFHRFERALRAGVVLEIRVSKAGQIGKYTRFSIRKRSLPARLDECLASTNPKPIECPA